MTGQRTKRAACRPARRTKERARVDVPNPPAFRIDRRCDVLVVGAGAAGLLAALSARGVLGADGARLPLAPDAPDVVLLNNEPRLGLKILVSGGGRCNLTNAQVSESDYDSDAPHLVRRLLRGFPVAAIREFFESRGCPLYEEALGKVFPRSDNAHDILHVLLAEVVRAKIPLIAPAEVTDLEEGAEGVTVHLSAQAPWHARRVILATGGKSLPKTGSRGKGLQLLSQLGHDLAAPLPALTPLLFAATSPLSGLAGLTVPVVLTLAADNVSPEQLAGQRFRPISRAGGSLLVTHGGATGPAPFDVSGACGRALASGSGHLHMDVWSLTRPEGPWGPYLDFAKAPGASLPASEVPRPPSRAVFDAQLEPLLANRERGLLSVLSERLPRSLVLSLLHAANVDSELRIKQLDSPARNRLWTGLTQANLDLVDCEGYAKAEVTSGGVRLAELVPATLQSRRAPWLYCCGEVVNVTGRLGGFNFQWAWSSGFAAGAGAA
ncbi:MAG: NAD(P)/FAD-dependent oxidoreductase, partial [Gammaproteobacteria bacterium]|nr:NAD(P)/FAD-dependent oxidoreductase [Gammaproteobacteria bacterium]